MNPDDVCESCMHADECMERRGQCADYKSYQDIIRQAAEDIARLNEERREKQ